MKLNFFSRPFVENLRKESESNVSKYDGINLWLSEFSKGKPYEFESHIDVSPPPRLVVTEKDNPANDAENSKLVYTWLSILTPTEAMEERLWAYLSHTIFADYMIHRWPLSGEAIEKGSGIINRRYLFEGNSFGALIRHGIARLWWSGYLTRDPDRENKFELTEVLYQRQDIQLALLDRSLGKCKRVRMSVLDFLRTNSDWISSASYGRRIQIILRELNLLGGVVILDALPEDELHEFLKKVGESLATS